MTAYGLAASLAWTAGSVYGLHRILELMRHALSVRTSRGTTDAQSRMDRLKLKAENRLAIARVSYPADVARPSKDIALPDDVEAWVMSWQDEFAREDERGAIRARYLEMYTGDVEQTWQMVRRSVGMGELP